MNKILIQIVFVVAISVVFQSCKTAPSYVFYHSEAGIPTKSSYVKSEFKLINSFKEILPFGVIACKDKSLSDSIINSYVIFTINSYYKGEIKDIYNHKSTLPIENIYELIKVIDKSIDIINNNNKNLNAFNLEYDIAKEHNVNQISANVEKWQSDFKYIFKGTKNQKEYLAYICLGKLINSETTLEYIYYLDSSQIIELKNRLLNSLELLNNWN